uniref:Uncharacterized protein n=1 Tax=Rhizophora mucronata TaxID=61149 RepID=A0A2P2PX88_RHIMU
MTACVICFFKVFRLWATRRGLLLDHAT